jgi:hypothetical protein
MPSGCEWCDRPGGILPCVPALLFLNTLAVGWEPDSVTYLEQLTLLTWWQLPKLQAGPEAQEMLTTLLC